MADKKFKLRFDVIGVIGIIVGLAGLYAYYKGTKPQFEVVVESVTNVVDVNERISGLGVLFNGEDLLKQDRALTIYSILLRNSGNDSLRKNDFDDKALVGVTLPGATLLSAQLDSSHTTAEAYVRKNVEIELLSPSTMVLRPLIIDPGVKIGVRIVAIHRASEQPKIIAVGKVVGQKQIPVILGKAEDRETSIWSRSFGGGLGVNLMRLPAYFFGFIILLVVAIGLPVSIGSLFSRLKRKKQIREFFELNPETPRLRWFANIFIKDGPHSLSGLLPIANDPNLVEQRRRHVAGDSSGRITEAIEFGPRPGVVFYSDNDTSNGLAQRAGLIEAAGESGYTTNQAAKAELEKLLNYLGIDASALPKNSRYDEDPGE